MPPEVTISYHFEVVAELTAQRDRVIADVAKALRNVNWHNDAWKQAADFIERTFGPEEGK